MSALTPIEVRALSIALDKVFGFKPYEALQVAMAVEYPKPVTVQ